jgi:hypothetical protein
MRMGDRPKSLTTDMYFDIRIGAIRVETVKQFKYLKIEKFKKKLRNKLKKNQFFFKNYSRPSVHQLGLKGPPAPAHDPGHVEDL